MAAKRSPFPPVFWVANVIEVLERFAYYGIYFGFGIYLNHLGFTRGDLGFVQALFLGVSYLLPVVSGTFADRYGFKPVLIFSYFAYLPAILLLPQVRSLAGISVAMILIGTAAGIFKPLISGTVRVTSDATNKTLGFGIFYAMVNVGGSLGPIVAGKLRSLNWDYVFYAAAAAIGLMLLITLFFYKEPPRQREGTTLGDKFREMGVVLSDGKFALFLLLLGVFFWLPFWTFFNVCAAYVDGNLDTAKLYVQVKGVLGTWITDNLLSAPGEDGVRRILGETISHTGWVIIALQLVVSRYLERFRAMPAFMAGLVVAAVGFVFMALARVGSPAVVFVGIFFFAVGEMASSPRIQEYITWIAPKEKAGLYMGSNFLATAIGAILGSFVYTPMYGWFERAGRPEQVWYVLAFHVLVGVLVFWVFMRKAGEFQELEA
jgi:MFS family permease